MTAPQDLEGCAAGEAPFSTAAGRRERPDSGAEGRAPRDLDGRRVHQIINSGDLDRGGAERIARMLHEDLRRRGVDARLVSIERSAEPDPPQGLRSLGLPGPYDPRAIPRIAAYLRGCARAGDIVHAHLFPASAHVAALRRLGMLRGPCLFTEHSTSNRRRAHPLGCFFDRFVYRAFDRVAAISGGVEAALLDAQPQLRGRTGVVLNGADMRFDRPPDRPARTGPATVLSIGRLTRPKNYPTALAALALLPAEAVRYVVLGEGGDRARLEELAGALGLAGRVSFVGHRSEIAPDLRDADIFLIPSLWEGFGLAAVEAMNAGLPLVAADVPGLREVVGRHGECAILVDPEDEAGMAAALASLIADPERRREMGRRGFEMAGRFDRARMTDAYLSLYSRTLRRTDGA